MAMLKIKKLMWKQIIPRHCKRCKMSIIDHNCKLTTSRNRSLTLFIIDWNIKVKYDLLQSLRWITSKFGNKTCELVAHDMWHILEEIFKYTIEFMIRILVTKDKNDYRYS